MRRHGWLAAFITLAAIGCGTESGIFSGDPSGSSGNPSSSGSTTSGNGGDGATTSSGNGGDPTSGTGGAPTTTSTGGAGATTGTGGASTTTSTGVGGDELPALDCGNTMCKPSDDDACCWDNYQFYGAPQGECVMGNTQSDGCLTSAEGEPQEAGAETRIECQTDVHCAAGTTCCGEIRQAFVGGNQQITYYESVTCQQSCTQQSEVQLCDPNVASSCSQGTCTQSQLLPLGYFVCVQ